MHNSASRIHRRSSFLIRASSFFIHYTSASNSVLYLTHHTSYFWQSRLFSAQHMSQVIGPRSYDIRNGPYITYITYIIHRISYLIHHLSCIYLLLSLPPHHKFSKPVETLEDPTMQLSCKASPRPTSTALARWCLAKVVAAPANCNKTLSGLNYLSNNY